MTAPVVGIVGGGQLARMMAEAATPLGVHVRVLAGPDDEGASVVVPDTVVGSVDDPACLRTFAASVDVLTFDHENVDHGLLRMLQDEGVVIRPSLRTLEFSDKAHQRVAFAAAGLPVPDFVVLDGSEDPVVVASRFAQRHNGTVVAKASRGGYDGRGVWMLDGEELIQFVSTWDGAPLVLEPRLDLTLEVAVLVARSPSGQVRTWPLVETIQVDGMCDEVVLPAPIPADLRDRAAQVGHDVAVEIGAVGVTAVELFVVDGAILVNEIAPRVHNSGHLTIEGSITSQFEQHLRAILDWPLGPTDPVSPVAVMANVVGGANGDPTDRQAAALAAVPEAHLHLYGKTPRPGRKIGHVTVLGADRETCRARARLAAAVLGGTAGPGAAVGPGGAAGPGGMEGSAS